MKFLVIRFSSIGDIVLTTPVVRCLKEQVKDAEVHFLTKKVYENIVAHNPFINKVFLLDDNWDVILLELQNEKYDYIIDLHHNLRTLRVKQALKGIKSFAYDKLNIQKWLLTNIKINIMPPVHIVDRYMGTISAFNVQNDGKGLDFFIPEKDIVPPNDIPASHQFGYIGIVIGAALKTKQLPIVKLKALCGQIDFPIILLGGVEDTAAGEEIASISPIKIYNACGKFNLNESADLVRKAKLIITHDTGLMHIAAAFKKRILTVWGNTLPAFGMGPYYGNSGVDNFSFEVKGLSCKPCSKIGYNKCPRKHFKCMLQQDVEAIAAKALLMVKG